MIEEIKKGMKIGDKIVDRVLIDLKIYYDPTTGNPIGNEPKDGQPGGLMMFDLNQAMPPGSPHFEVREITVVIFKKKKK